jgi:hypothetical protein
MGDASVIHDRSSLHVLNQSLLKDNQKLEEENKKLRMQNLDLKAKASLGGSREIDITALDSHKSFRKIDQQGMFSMNQGKDKVLKSPYKNLIVQQPTSGSPYRTLKIQQPDSKSRKENLISKSPITNPRQN